MDVEHEIRHPSVCPWAPAGPPIVVAGLLPAMAMETLVLWYVVVPSDAPCEDLPPSRWWLAGGLTD